MSPPLLTTLAILRPYALLGTPIRRAQWTPELPGDEWPWQAVTVVAGTDVFTAAAHGYQDGTEVKFDSVGVLPAGLTHSGSYYVRDATLNTFKVAIGPGLIAIDITDAGTSTHRVRKTLTRTWFTYEHKFWWRIDADGAAYPARAGDLTAADHGASDWTTMSQACMDAAFQTQLRQGSQVLNTSCAVPILQPAAVSPEPAIVPAGAIVTAPTTTGSTEPIAGDSDSGGGALGGGGGAIGGDGGGGGALGGGGSGDGGGAPSGGAPTSPTPGGGAPGGGGGGGGTPPAEDPFAPPGADNTAGPWLPNIGVTLVHLDGNGTDSGDMYKFSVECNLDTAADGDEVSAREMFYVRLVVGGAVRWSGYAKAGSFIQSAPFWVYVAPTASNSAGGVLYYSGSVSLRGFKKLVKGGKLNQPPQPWPEVVD